MSIIDGDRLMEDGGKACGDISHRLCPEEDFTEAGNRHVSEEKLDVDLYGYTSVDIDESHREPGSVEEKRLQDGISVSARNQRRENQKPAMLLLMRRSGDLICMDISSTMISRTS